jgi:putative methyltransferase (TIGR04325 family)
VTAKGLLKRVCPPVLVDLVRGRSLFPKPPVVWEGIYPDRQSVPTRNGTYDDEARIAEFLDRARAARALVAAGRKPDVGCAWHEALGVLSAIASVERRALRVLDFGGGVGFAFIQLLSTLRNDVTVDYHVVDLEKICAAGRELFADDPRIQFHTSLPADQRDVDIVYVSTALPYIDDYAGLLRRLVGMNARYVLLNRLAAGDFPTYAARQVNLSGQALAYWFLNRDEVVRLVAAGGYSLVHEEQVGEAYDQREYPHEYRVGRMRTLLFARNEDGAR